MTTTPKSRPIAPDFEHPSQLLRDGVASAEIAWLAPLSGAGTAMVEAWADLFEEASSFLARRVRQDVRTLHRILHSRSPRDLQAAQAEFVQRAVDEYIAEFGRVMARLTAGGQGGVAPEVAGETASAPEATPV